MDLATGEDVEVRAGFVIVRAPRNGDLPHDYLRAFEIVGRDGLVPTIAGSRVMIRRGDEIDSPGYGCLSNG